MNAHLPPRPSLEFLKKQAKQLLQAARAGEPEALARLARHLGESRLAGPRASAADGGRPWPALADVQLVLAREYGFANWSALKQEVELAALAEKSKSERAAVLLGACLEGRLEQATRLLERYPDLPTDNIYLAAATGDIDHVTQMLASDATLVHAPGGPLSATPLVYACTSRFAAPAHKRSAGILAIVKLLLARGADPNAGWLNPDFDHCRLSALYGAAGCNHHPELTQLLLDSGATPNDGESLYHSTEHGSTDCVRLLLDHGAEISGTNAIHQAIACHNLPAVRLFLERGANVDERLGPQQSMTLLHWAIDCNVGPELLQLLVDNGADLRATSDDGQTPFERAARLGHQAAIELLRARGAAEELSPRQQLIAACMAGDERLARQLLHATSLAVTDLAADERSQLSAAAWRRNLPAVRAMLAVGFDPDWSNEHRATALHCAAWKGDADIVQLLLTHGASCTPRDTQFDCTPLEWALHGSRYCSTPEPAVASGRIAAPGYAAIVDLLLPHSPPPVQRLVNLTSGAVEERLNAQGYGVDDGLAAT